MALRETSKIKQPERLLKKKVKKCYTYNNNNIDINFNTTDIKISDYNHDEVNHNLVARQYIKVW